MKIYARDEQLIEAGATPYYLATLWFWFRRENDQYIKDRIDLDTIDRAASHIDEDPPLFVLNIEEWDLSDSDVREHAICNLRVAALKIRQHFDCPIGYYRLLPERNYWSPVKQRQALDNWDRDEWLGRKASMEAWRQRNTANAADLLSLVDTVLPSVYEFYNDDAAWRHYAIANLDEAFRIAKGRRVIPFVSPQIAGGGETIEPSRIAMQLDVLNACGVEEVVVYEQGASGDWRQPIIEAMQ